ncbi:VENN motif pre-toxin domain-containing protein [Biostraticola tofi]|uniref:VENN motif-containing pre-toxin protein n=1 Tax=Biostraticola tofi TaxID=466109 RepID=A0A4R3YFX1_9GAMM|nr:VENN motif pre-toxin domain-containing protein [Biostraticola tofi]TCV91046.1 VENN motif-containing pre-toxin protein [Biostraticola tofi]
MPPIFNKEHEQQRLQQAKKIGDIATQVSGIIEMQGKIAAAKVGTAKADTASAEERSAARSQWEQDHKGKTATQADIHDQLFASAYHAALVAAEMQTGGEIKRASQSAIAVVQGLATGNIAQAIAGGSAPYIAHIIKKTTAAGPERLMAHAVVGAVVAQLSGGNALAGASGAAMGEYIASQVYAGIEAKDLTESQKTVVSALGTLAAGLAGGLAGGDVASAVAGAQAGKNAVENNFLSPESMPKGLQDYGQSVQSYVQYAQDKNLPPEQVQADLARMVKGDLPESADIIKAILSNNPGSDTVMALLDAKESKDYALALLTSIPAEKALSLVGKATGVISNKILISAAEKISTAKPGKQSAIPRDLNEQIVLKQVQENPAKGEILPGMNSDPRFPASAGFQKMQAVQKNAEGKSITIHYQYNSTTGKAYDIKIDTPQRVKANPADVIENIKGQVK